MGTRDTLNHSRTYVYTVTALYVVGFALNCWMVIEILKQDEMGAVAWENMKAQTVGRFNKVKNGLLTTVNADAVINEAEQILKAENE